MVCPLSFSPSVHCFVLYSSGVRSGILLPLILLPFLLSLLHSSHSTAHCTHSTILLPILLSLLILLPIPTPYSFYCPFYLFSLHSTCWQMTLSTGRPSPCVPPGNFSLPDSPYMTALSPNSNRNVEIKALVKCLRTFDKMLVSLELEH